VLVESLVSASNEQGAKSTWQGAQFKILNFVEAQNLAPRIQLNPKFEIA